MEKFLEKAKTVHGNKYDYSKVEYKNANNKVIIICRSHGEFYPLPGGHIAGRGCRKCVSENNSKKYRSDINDIIKNFKEIHKDENGEPLYDYSLIKEEDYINQNSKLKIICKIHGLFEKSANTHKKGGCVSCGILKRNKSKKLDFNFFLNKCKEIHQDKYDYSLIKEEDYINQNSKLKIICKIHGLFNQKAGSHYIGRGCRKCGTVSSSNTRRSNTEEFIEKAKKVHGDKYDYSKVEYIDCNTKIIIGCKIHLIDFNQIPYSHLEGVGCSKCGRERTINFNINYFSKSNSRNKWTSFIFIEKAKKIHGDKYDYSKVEYIDSTKKIIIGCKIHGYFDQLPLNHIKSDTGCTKCGNELRIKNLEKYINNKKLTTQDFIEKSKKVHGDKYDYSKVEYIDSTTKVNINCEIHGIFEQIASDHLSGRGCSKCKNKTEGIVYNFLCKIFNEVYYQYSPEWAINDNKNKLRFDFYIPFLNIIIELDGKQHFNKDHKWYDNQHEKDIFKTNLANKNKIYVIRLTQEDVWNNMFDWKELLSEIFMDEINDNIFISESNIYEEHVNILNKTK